MNTNLRLGWTGGHAVVVSLDELMIVNVETTAGLIVIVGIGWHEVANLIAIRIGQTRFLCIPLEIIVHISVALRV